MKVGTHNSIQKLSKMCLLCNECNLFLHLDSSCKFLCNFNNYLLLNCQTSERDSWLHIKSYIEKFHSHMKYNLSPVNWMKSNSTDIVRKPWMLCFRNTQKDKHRSIYYRQNVRRDGLGHTFVNKLKILWSCILDM